MTSTSIFFFFIPLVTGILLLVNLIFATSRPYHEKNSTFECGYHSFLGQNRSQFNISFFIFGLLFLLFDLEIALLFPYIVSAYNNELFGLIVILVFIFILTLGFVFEFGKNALKIPSKQNNDSLNSFSSHSSNGFKKKNSFNLNTIRQFHSSHINKNNQLKKKINSDKKKSHFKFIFNNKNKILIFIIKAAIIFTAGLITRCLINEGLGINVFTEYLNSISLIFYGLFSNFIVFINNLD